MDGGGTFGLKAVIKPSQGLGSRSATLAKVANNLGKGVIHGWRRHFWPESYHQTFARVGLIQIIHLEFLLQQRVHLVHNERLVVGRSREILPYKRPIRQRATPLFYPFQVVAVWPHLDVPLTQP